MEPEQEKQLVGYGRPPAEHRFTKGQSGNSKGRPKGARHANPKAVGLDFGTQPANRMLIEEAYRTIAVREGEQVVELPVIKAIFRALGVSAMKGNRLAQKTMAELIRGIEEDDRKLRVDHFAAACEYKWDWEQAIEHASRNGMPEPTPIPHPGDVIIDTRNADVRYAGPMTPEEKEIWDRMLEFRAEEQRFVTFWARQYRKTGADDVDEKERVLGMWHSSQRLYDRINDPLPERYRRSLNNRSSAAGATKPGEFTDRGRRRVSSSEATL